MTQCMYFVLVFLTAVDWYLEFIKTSLPFDSSLEHCLHFNRSSVP